MQDDNLRIKPRPSKLFMYEIFYSDLNDIKIKSNNLSITEFACGASKILKNPKIAEGIAKQHPLKRIGEGKDAAALAKFLLSDESSWITGQIIGVDGGRSNVG